MHGTNKMSDFGLTGGFFPLFGDIFDVYCLQTEFFNVSYICLDTKAFWNVLERF